MMGGVVFVFFFFQAEDGIRDGTVTGVQTCALPISGGLQAAFTVSQGGSLAGIAPASARVPALIGGVGRGQALTRATLQVGSLVLPVRIVGRMNAFPAATERGLPFAVVPVRALIERFQQALRPPGGVF